MQDSLCINDVLTWCSDSWKVKRVKAGRSPVRTVEQWKSALQSTSELRLLWMTSSVTALDESITGLIKLHRSYVFNQLHINQSHWGDLFLSECKAGKKKQMKPWRRFNKEDVPRPFLSKIPFYSRFWCYLISLNHLSACVPRRSGSGCLSFKYHVVCTLLPFRYRIAQLTSSPLQTICEPTSNPAPRLTLPLL